MLAAQLKFDPSSKNITFSQSGHAVFLTARNLSSFNVFFNPTAMRTYHKSSPRYDTYNHIAFRGEHIQNCTSQWKSSTKLLHRGEI